MDISKTITKIADIAEGPKPKEQLLFSSEQADDATFKNVNIHTSVFSEIGLKNSKFCNSSFTQSHFTSVYFRGANLSNVRFTGSTFSGCNFKKCSFQSCDFRYCSFYMCELPVDEIISCLPSEPNLRRDLARNLRVNAESLGEKRNADIFLDIEIKATEQTDKEIFFSKTKYYKDSYDSLTRLQSGAKYIISKLSGATWGYGHKFGRLLLSYLLVALAISLVKYFWKIDFLDNGNTTQLSFLESIYVTFSESVGAYTQKLVPISTFWKTLLYLEKLIFSAYLALLAATLYRKIAR